MHRSLLLLPLLSLLGCPPVGSADDDDDDDAALDDWTIQVDNAAANTFALLQQRPCESTDPESLVELPLPVEGLAPGASRRWLLATPACYALSLEGEGCFADVETGALEADGRYVWVVTDDALLCQGR